MEAPLVLPQRLYFRLPLVPPSVNHYVDHGKGHKLTPAAQAFRRAFMQVLPAKIRGTGVTSASRRFAVTLRINPGPGGKGDIDNYSKLIYDCCAAAGMFLDGKGKELSDACVKESHNYLDDAPEQRVDGPSVQVTIEALESFGVQKMWAER